MTVPSKDTYHAKHPEANEWMSRDPEKLSATVSRARGGIVSRTAKRALSAQVLRLARRLERDPDELAKKIPADTLRRTKYPVIEQVNEDGTRTFKHDLGVTDGPRYL
jgi:hypothetical protein